MSKRPPAQFAEAIQKIVDPDLDPKIRYHFADPLNHANGWIFRIRHCAIDNSQSDLLARRPSDLIKLASTYINDFKKLMCFFQHPLTFIGDRKTLRPTIAEPHVQPFF